MIDYIAQIDDLYDINTISMMEYSLDALGISDDVLTEGEKFNSFKQKAGNVWTSIKKFFINIWSKIKEFWSKHFGKNKKMDEQLAKDQANAKKALESSKVKGNAGRILNNIAKVSDTISDDGKNVKANSAGRSRIIMLKKDKVNTFISETEKYTDVLGTVYDMMADVDSSGVGNLDTSSVSQLTREYQNMYNDKVLERLSDVYEEKFIKDESVLLGLLGEDKKFTDSIYDKLEKVNKNINSSYDKIIKKIESIEKSAMSNAKLRVDKSKRNDLGDKGFQVSKNAAVLGVLKKAVSGRTQLFFKTLSMLTKHKSYLHNYYLAIIKVSGSQEKAA